MTEASPPSHARRSRPWLPFFVGLVAVAGLVVAGFSSRRADASKPLGITVGVLGGPEAEVLEFVSSRRPDLDLQVVRYDDARSLRAAVKRGEVAAGSFETNASLHQTQPDPELGSAGTTLTLPLGFYSKRIKTLNELTAGAVIALPAEPEAQGRALLLLFHSGLVVIPEELGTAVRLTDVSAILHQLELRPLPRERLASAFGEAALVGLEYATAAQSGLAPARHAILMEDGFSPYAQILTVRRADLATPPAWLGSLLDAYHSQQVKTFILEHFEDSVRRPW